MKQPQNNTNPMDISEIRRRNLRTLVQEAESAADLARRTGTNAAYISHILSENVDANMGTPLARKIERALRLERGWMDVLHATSQDQQASLLSTLPTDTRDFVETAMLIYEANPDYAKQGLRKILADILSGKIKKP